MARRPFDQAEKRLFFCVGMLLATINASIFISQNSDLIISLLIGEGITAVCGVVIWSSYLIFPDRKDDTDG